MNKQFINWLIFVILSFIWGSSFILMLIGMKELSPYQVAAIRILSAGLVLSPLALKYLREVPLKEIWLIFFCGALGNLVPAFLFCLSEEVIESSLVGTLNSLTPIFVIITGAMFFNLHVSFSRIIGVMVALAGSFLLLFSKGSLSGSQNLLYVSFVVVATIMYGLNVNIVHKYLPHVSSLKITAIALSLNAIPALAILAYTGFFHMQMSNKFFYSVGAASVLGIVGTAIATYLFYALVKRAGGLFATTVTYGIPFVAIGWGILLVGEKFGYTQLLCLLLLLAGVYIANRKKEG